MNGRTQSSFQLRRSAARLACVQALYEIDVTGSSSDPVLREFIAERWKAPAEGADLPEPDAAFLSELVRGVCMEMPRLDQAIEQALAGRTLDRLEVLLRAVLRAGAYELADRPEIPEKVVINEYMDVAHAFFAGRETGLVNAVLDRLIGILRGSEGAAAGRGNQSPVG